MSMPSKVAHKEAELAGNIYELTSKFGLLSGLQYKINEANKNRNPKSAYKRAQLSRNLATQILNNSHVLQSAKISLRDCVKSCLQTMEREGLEPHLLFPQYLISVAENYSPHGYTVAKEIIDNLLNVAAIHSRNEHNKRLSLELLYLWAPVFTPGTNRYESEQQEYSDFCNIFDIPTDKASEYFKRGQVGKCDFLVCFKSDDFIYLSVIEFSHKYDTYFYQLEGDVELFEIHRRKNGAYNSTKGGVFNFINEDILTSSFKMSEIHKDTNLATYYTDKSFMKLSQAASYADSAIKLLKTKYKDLKIYVDIQSMLNLEPAQVIRGFIDSPIENMLRSMSELYRKDKTVTDSIEEYHEYVARELETHLQVIDIDARDKVYKSLAQSFQKKEYAYDITYENILKGLNTTNNQRTVDEFCQKITDAELAMHTRRIMKEKSDSNDNISYRDAHASAIIASLEQAPRGKISLLGLVGNAGIGKTTAFSNYLKNTDFGWFGLYSSCRVTINKDVLQGVSQASLDDNLGICCLTTNSKYIKAAPKYAENSLENYETLKQQKHHIDSAVVVGGITSLSVFNAGCEHCFSVEDVHAAMFSKEEYIQSPKKSQKGTLLINSHVGGETGLEKHTDKVQYQTATISKTQEKLINTTPVGVFKSLLRAYQRIIELNPKVKKTLICLATQAFKLNSRGENPLIELKNIIYGGDDVDLSTKINRLQHFANRQSDIYVMLDEITGDEDGVSLSLSAIQALQQVFIDPFQQAGIESPFKVVVLLADASLASPESMQNYLCSGDTSARVSVYDTDAQGVDFKVTRGSISIPMNMRMKDMPIVYVETNTYPAPNLKIRNRMVLTRDVRDDLDIGIKLNPSEEGAMSYHINNMSDDSSKARKSNIIPRSVSIAVEEIERAISKGGFSEKHQVIYFSQNRQELEWVKRGLINNNIVKSSEVTTITSSTSDTDKKKVLDPNHRDGIKVVLMTSAASRGLSFPRATTIIGNVPDFNIESQLMEVMQLAYRGRGGYVDDYGNVAYGDSLDKQLVFIVNDAFLVDGDLPEEDLAMKSTSLWFKKTRDMLMILSLIKACLLSRVSGNAGLNHPCMIIPIGPSSDKKLRNIGFAERINELNKELSNMILSGGEDDKKMAINIQEKLIDVFCSADYKFVPTQQEKGEVFILYGSPDFAKIKDEITWTLDKCIFTVDKHYSANLNNLDFVGDLVIQRLSHKSYEEAVKFSLDGDFDKKAYFSLKYRLSEMLTIYDGRVNSALRSAASDIEKLMDRQYGSHMGSYDLTQHTNQSSDSYIIWPINMHKIWRNDKKFVPSNQFRENIDDEMIDVAWHSGLKQPLGMAVARPLLPYYKHAPFIITGDKPNAYGNANKTRINKTDVLLTTGTNMINLLFLDK